MILVHQRTKIALSNFVWTMQIGRPFKEYGIGLKLQSLWLHWQIVYKLFIYFIDKILVLYKNSKITIICSQQLVHCTNFRNVNKKLDQQISYPLRSVNEININLPRYLYLPVIASFSNITSKPFLPCYFFV